MVKLPIHDFLKENNIEYKLKSLNTYDIWLAVDCDGMINAYTAPPFHWEEVEWLIKKPTVDDRVELIGYVSLNEVDIDHKKYEKVDWEYLAESNNYDPTLLSDIIRSLLDGRQVYSSETGNLYRFDSEDQEFQRNLLFGGWEPHSPDFNIIMDGEVSILENK